MIREHSFNTKWFGERVGVVTNTDFFGLSAAQQNELLRPFSWVEFSNPFGSVSLSQLSQAGFNQVDTQVNFRLRLSSMSTSSSIAALRVRSADTFAFQISNDDLETFTSERFFVLPGVGEDEVNTRYSLWAETLIAENPHTCLEIASDNGVEGWFLSRPLGKS